jgi:tight adherence protein B
MLTILIIGASFIGVACLVGGVATILLRSSGEVAIENRLDVLTGAAQSPGAKANEPSLLSTPLNDVPNVMEEFVKRFFNLRSFLQQADTQLTPAKFIVISVTIGVGTMFILPLVRVPLILAPLGLLM